MAAIDNNVVLEHVLKDWAIDFEITPDILSLAKAMSANRAILTGAYRSMLTKQTSFKIKPLFSEEYRFNFDYEARLVKISQGETRVGLSIDQLRLLLGKVDAATSPIYSLGSIVKLNDAMLPDGLLDLAQLSDESHGLVSITGRKLQLIEPFNKYVVDYIATAWPIGGQVGEQPMMVSNMMIDSIVFKGFSNPDEEAFTDALHAAQIEAQQISTAFMSGDDQSEFMKEASSKSKN
ncbi:DUF4176 domain-containing protein [Lacticaseibacillus pantheris]|uniref:DUF4176 domain-containing protein n=1 Tax=Lacticaseibacillus pantheris TaxID=171523 RepID=UPI0026581EF5|nr:DUF4176 domain-containing protein [Lacticaseibacillus pantheris]WKF84415.1 DUF4176 domain-containing protein [Lacticaseibacillus pantheris]